MKCLGIIPARKGSKRVPGKNTKLLNGVPLVHYVLQACSQATRIDALLVSSDDEDVANVTRNFHRATFLKRPASLATDESLAIDYVKHALESYPAFDTVVIVQPTTPFVTASDIDNTIDLLRQDASADSAVSVVQLDQLHHPLKLKVMEGTELRPYFQDEKGILPAKDLPTVYSRNGAVYATRVTCIEAGSIIGKKCLGYVMPAERSVDINYPIDFDFAEFLAKKYNF